MKGSEEIAAGRSHLQFPDEQFSKSIYFQLIAEDYYNFILARHPTCRYISMWDTARLEVPVGYGRFGCESFHARPEESTFLGVILGDLERRLCTFDTGPLENAGLCWIVPSQGCGTLDHYGAASISSCLRSWRKDITSWLSTSTGKVLSPYADNRHIVHITMATTGALHG